MTETTIRGGKDAVTIEVSEDGVRIGLGPDSISASVVLDFGEARLLAESILAGMQDLLEVASQDDVSISAVAERVLGLWRIVHDDQVAFQELGRRDRDLVLLRNPELWPMGDVLPVKRWRPNPPPAPKAKHGHMETGLVRRGRGPTIWDGPDLTLSYENFEDLVADGWRVD